MKISVLKKRSIRVRENLFYIRYKELQCKTMKKESVRKVRKIISCIEFVEMAERALILIKYSHEDKKIFDAFVFLFQNVMWK
jgi:hypothetical protein